MNRFAYRTEWTWETSQPLLKSESEGKALVLVSGTRLTVLGLEVRLKF